MQRKGMEKMELYNYVNRSWERWCRKSHFSRWRVTNRGSMNSFFLRIEEILVKNSSILWREWGGINHRREIHTRRPFKKFCWGRLFCCRSKNRKKSIIGSLSSSHSKCQQKSIFEETKRESQQQREGSELGISSLPYMLVLHRLPRK